MRDAAALLGALGRSGPRLWVAATALLFVWAGFFLVRVPAAGAADRGDYYRVARPAGILSGKPSYTSAGVPLLQRTYAVKPLTLQGGLTTASAVAAAARPLGVMVGGGRFDLRALGATYLFTAACLVALSLRAGASPALCFLLVWVLVDPAYLAYFNSLYTEAPALVALFGLVLWFLKWGDAAGDFFRLRTRRELFGATALTLLFGGLGLSRLSASLLPSAVLALLFCAWYPRRRAFGARGAVLWGCLSLIAVLSPLHFTVGSGPRFFSINRHHAVFMGIATVSSAPAQVLERLGIPAEYAPLVGKSYFEAKRPRELRQALLGVSRFDVAWEYLRDPRALGGAAVKVHHHVGKAVPKADFELESPERRDAVFFRFAPVRAFAVGLFPPLVAALPFVAAALLRLRRKRGGPSPRRFSLFLLLAILLTQVPLTILGDGFYGIGRHLLLARFAFDLLFVLLLYEAICLLHGRPSPSGDSAERSVVG